MPSTETTKGEYFFLQAKDDSMRGAGILRNSRVLVRRQKHTDHNEFALVMVDSKTMIRQIQYTGGHALLIPANPDFPPEVHAVEEIDIIGKAVKVETSLEPQ